MVNNKENRVHFDTNVYYAIRQARHPSEYKKQFPVRPDEIELIKRRIADGLISCWEAPSNLTEVLRKINADRLGVKRLLEISKELNGDRILPIPEDFVRNEINEKYGSNLKIKKISSEFIKIRDLVLADQPSNPWVVFDEYEKIATKVIAAINSFRPGFIEGVIEVYSGSFSLDIYKGKVNGVIDSGIFDVLLLSAFIDRFGLGELEPRIISRLGTEGIYELFKGYYRAVLKKVVNENRALEVNDYMDEEQIIYIDEISYFVAVDSKFSAVYANAFPGTQRASKMVTWAEFIDVCSRLT